MRDRPGVQVDDQGDVDESGINEGNLVEVLVVLVEDTGNRNEKQHEQAYSCKADIESIFEEAEYREQRYHSRYKRELALKLELTAFSTSLTMTSRFPLTVTSYFDICKSPF